MRRCIYSSDEDNVALHSDMVITLEHGTTILLKLHQISRQHCFSLSISYFSLLLFKFRLIVSVSFLFRLILYNLGFVVHMVISGFDSHTIGY